MKAAALESRARDQHPDFCRAVQRVGYIVELMANCRWVRGKTAAELAEDWGLSKSVVETYSTEASRHLELLGQREAVLNIVRASAHRWVQESDNDRVAAAKLLVDTVGGFEQRHKVEHALQQRPASELVAGALEFVEQHLDGLPGVHERILAMAERIRGNRALLTVGTETTERPSEKRHDPVD